MEVAAAYARSYRIRQLSEREWRNWQTQPAWSRYAYGFDPRLPHQNRGKLRHLHLFFAMRVKHFIHCVCNDLHEN